MRELPITATIELMGSDLTLRVTNATRAFLDERRSVEITLAPGTCLRHRRHVARTDVCSDIYMDFDALFVLTGTFTGQLVYIEDAATPRDRNAAAGHGPHLGPRPRLGLPPSIVEDSLEVPDRLISHRGGLTP